MPLKCTYPAEVKYGLNRYLVHIVTLYRCSLVTIDLQFCAYIVQSLGIHTAYCIQLEMVSRDSIHVKTTTHLWMGDMSVLRRLYRLQISIVKYVYTRAQNS
jgi:hypothetical protein